MREDANLEKHEKHENRPAQRLRATKSDRHLSSPFALAIAKMSNSPMTALYVLGTIGLGAVRHGLQQPSAAHHYEKVVLEDVVELADREGCSIHTALRLHVSPEDAILRQARLGRYNLIVLGVGRPAGKALFFGKIAEAILENSNRSILFLSS